MNNLLLFAKKNQIDRDIPIVWTPHEGTIQRPVPISGPPFGFSEQPNQTAHVTIRHTRFGRYERLTGSVIKYALRLPLVVTPGVLRFCPPFDI